MGGGRRLAAGGAAVAITAVLVTVAWPRGGASEPPRGGVVVDAGGGRRTAAPSVVVPAGPRDGTSPRGLPVTVEPALGNHDGQTVTVTGAAYSPLADVGVVQCTTRARFGGGVNFCDTSRVGRARTDAAGAFSTTFVLSRFIKTPNDGVVDCGTPFDVCVVAAGNTADYDESGAAPLAWDGSPPPPPPSLRLEPEGTLLRHGSPVTVVGADHAPGSTRSLLQCAAAASGDPSSRICIGLGEEAPVDVAPDGSFRARVRPIRLLMQDGPDEVDCARVACTIETEGSGARATSSVALRFDAADPPPPPRVVTVTPDRALRPGDRVLVRGRHFVPGWDVHVWDCPAVTDEGECGAEAPPGVDVAEDGTFSLLVTVTGRNTTGRTTTDCRDGGCVLLVSQRSAPPVVVPLRFR